MIARISPLRRLLDFLFPRHCAVCHKRLAVTDDGVCTICNLHLPRTHFHENPTDNEMARHYWAVIPVERATALFFYYAKSEASNIILNMKYRGKWDLAEIMGRLAANECLGSGFFEGIDVIVPIPTTRKRKMERGYNQAHLIAKGISQITGIPIADDAVERAKYDGSQTHKNADERQANVKGVFKLKRAERIRNKHVLLVDDVMTTGATTKSCASELMKGGAKLFSIMALGYTKH